MDQQQLISRVVSEVLSRLQQQQAAVKGGQTGFGVYEKMEDAIAAAQKIVFATARIGRDGAQESHRRHPPRLRGERQSLGRNRIRGDENRLSLSTK